MLNWSPHPWGLIERSFYIILMVFTPCKLAFVIPRREASAQSDPPGQLPDSLRPCERPAKRRHAEGLQARSISRAVPRSVTATGPAEPALQSCQSTAGDRHRSSSLPDANRPL